MGTVSSYPWNPRIGLFWMVHLWVLGHSSPICPFVCPKSLPRDNAPWNKKEIVEILFTLNEVSCTTNKTKSYKKFNVLHQRLDKINWVVEILMRNVWQYVPKKNELIVHNNTWWPCQFWVVPWFFSRTLGFGFLEHIIQNQITTSSN